MSRDGYGNYNLPVAAFVNGNPIIAGDVNSDFSDIATALTSSISRDGQTSPTANLPMAAYNHTNVGNATARSQYPAMGQLQDDTPTWCGTAGGSADTLTLAPSPAITAYVAGQKFRFKALSSNVTNTPTVVVSGLTGPVTIQDDGGLVSPAAIASGKFYEITFDGTYFQLSRIRSGASTLNLTAAINEAYITVPSGPVAAQTISSLSVPNATSVNVTMITAIAHGLGVGNVIIIIGATSANYNGTWTILTIPNTTTVTFNVSVAPAATATVVGSYTVQAGNPCPIGAALGNFINITGTTTITAFDTVQAGTRREVVFAGVLTLTHNATTIILPTALPITTAAGDTATFISLGSGNWRCVKYQLYSGLALVSAPQAAVLGATRNAKMSVTAASATGTFTADEIVVETVLGGAYKRLASYSQAVNLATTGAGAMDTGAAPVSGFVNLYAIYNPTTLTTSILAQNAATNGSPSIYGGASIPSGYTYSALIGIWPTNGSSQFVPGLIADPLGRKFSYQTYPVIFTAHAAITTLTSQSISGAVPAAARTASLELGSTSTGASGPVFGAAGDATGTGGKYTSAGGSASLNPTIGGMPSLGSALSVGDIPLITAQTVFVLTNGGGSTNNIYVSDFSW